MVDGLVSRKGGESSQDIDSQAAPVESLSRPLHAVCIAVVHLNR